MSYDPSSFRLRFAQDPTKSQNVGAPSATQSGGGAAPTGTTGSTQQPGSSPGPQQDMCGGNTMLMMGVFVVLMWLMVLGPERKRKKQTEQMLSSLKAGDRVVTIGGMHGVVSQVGDKTVTVRFDQQKAVFDRSAIARVERDEPAKDEAKKS